MTGTASDIGKKKKVVCSQGVPSFRWPPRILKIIFLKHETQEVRRKTATIRRRSRRLYTPIRLHKYRTPLPVLGFAMNNIFADIPLSCPKNWWRP